MNRLIEIERQKCEKLRDVLLKQHVSMLQKVEPSERSLLMVASLLKLREQARAALILSEHAFVEEILSIARTMSEVAINSAYFQFAEDEELSRFMHFDTQAMYKFSNNMKERTGTELDPQFKQVIESEVRNARTLTGKQDKDLSWSVRQLMHRAEFVDNRMKAAHFVGLAATSYSWSHRAVHATHDAIAPFYKALETGAVPLTEERAEALEVALYCVNFALHTAASFIERQFHLGTGTDIVSVSQSM